MQTGLTSKKVIKAESMLLLTAAIWGFSFVAQRAGMEHIGPFAFNGIRFALGSLSLVPLLLLNRKKGQKISLSSIKPQTLKGGIVLGLLLFTGASLQQIGMIYTTAGNAGFITSLYVIFVPIIGLFFKHKVTFNLWIGALLAVIGLYFLSVTETLIINKGDAFVFISAFFWAFHVLAISHFAPKSNVILLSFLQFALCSALSMMTAMFFEEYDLQAIYSAAIPILYGGLMAVGVAFTLQIYAQKTAPPSHAAIILSLESFFAALGGWMILNEEFNSRKIIGCLLMLTGVIISQLKLRKKSLDD